VGLEGSGPDVSNVVVNASSTLTPVDTQRNATHSGWVSRAIRPAPRFVAVYVRCSTAEQAASGLGLQSQLERSRAYVAALGLADGTEVREFVDAGESAATTDRPALQALLAEVRGRRVSVVVVAKLDRLSRRLADVLDLVETLERSGASLASVAERIDASSASGRLMLQMLGSFAEFEREQIRQRTREAVRAKRSRGESHGFVPFGSQEVARRLAPAVAEVDAIETMRRLRGEGASLREIAAELQARAIPTKRGGTWRPATVLQILRRVDGRDRRGEVIQ
jgi:site-specific DNA recombinase